MSEATLSLTVDGRPTSTPTATITVHLTASDSKAVAELALQNLLRDLTEATAVVHLIIPHSKTFAEAVAGLPPQNLMRDIPRGPHTGGTLAKKAVEGIGRIDWLVDVGNGVVENSKDVVEAFKDAVPTIDGVVANIDKIADVRIFRLRYF